MLILLVIGWLQLRYLWAGDILILYAVPLAIAYASGFPLLWLNEAWIARLMSLAPVGRMALTNCLMQKVIALLLFNGIGLGLGTRLSAWQFESLALSVFIVQVHWICWWLKRFRFGPCEWASRSLTYGRVMPLFG